MKGISVIFLLFCFQTIGQIQGVIIANDDGSPIFNALIISSEGKKARSTVDGEFIINADEFPIKLFISANEFQSDTITIYSSTEQAIIILNVPTQNLKTVVVSANRRNQNVEEVPISMEVIKPSLIENKGLVNLEQVVDQSPGVYAMDGQVSIRGGGGYAYGVGSRVMVLTNGIPLVSPDLGDAKWNSIPMENTSQVEVIKGASSVLYGSGALNGTISLHRREPTTQGETEVRLQSGVYGNPKRSSLIWWDRNPMFHEISAYHGKAKKKFGYTISLNGFTNEGYKDGETEERARLSGGFSCKPTKAKGLKLNLDYSGQVERLAKFIIWESDSLAYTPLGGSSDNPSDNTLTNEKSIRLNIDPSLLYIDKKGNKHSLKNRYYLVTIGGSNSFFQASAAHMFYSDYSFQKTWKKRHTLTSGATAIENRVISGVFGNHSSTNFAAYSQYEFNLKRFGFSAGIRAEYFQQDTLKPDSQFDYWETGSEIPIYPILRSTARYALTKSTHLRASIGQGIRFPSVSERYANTSNGGIYIFPNPNLSPEKGWAAEVGIRQVFKSGDWKGIADVAGFINRYDDMIEFAFGVYIPDSITPSLDPNSPGYINKWVGFKAQNAEKAVIKGIELSFNSEGKIKKVGIQSLIGYTYMDPQSLNQDPAYISSQSDTSAHLLKYRFNHLFRLDLEASYKQFALGFSSRYNSYMYNIDQIFEAEIYGTEIIPGLKNYRDENQTGSLVFDTRFRININQQLTISMIVNNLLNAEYSSRPADIQPPRNYIVQLKYKL